MPESETIKIQVLWTELLKRNKMFSKRPELVEYIRQNTLPPTYMLCVNTFMSS